MKRFPQKTLGACGRMLLEIFLLFPALLVLGNALLGKTVMLPVFFAELAVAGLSGVILRRFISSAKILPAIGAPLCIGEVILFAIAFGGVYPNAYILPILLTLLTFYRGKQHAESAWAEILPNNVLFLALVLQFIVLLVAGFYGVTDAYFTLLCVVVPIVYVTAFIVLNRLALRSRIDDAQPRTGVTSLNVIGDLKPVSRALLAILLILAIALSLSTTLLTAAGWLFDKLVFVIGWAAALFYRFINSFSFSTGALEEESPVVERRAAPEDIVPQESVFGYIFIGILAVILLILLYRFVRRLIPLIIKAFADSPKIDVGGETALFEDTREKLLDLSQLPKLYAARAKDRISGLFKRTPGWEDMPTPAEKLKYLYRKVLQKAEGCGYAHRKSYTAEEAIRIAAQSWKPLAKDAKTLADAYSALRYGNHTPDPEKLEELHHRLGDL